MDVIESVRKALIAQRAQIDAALAALGGAVNAVPPPARPQPKPTKKRRKFSAESRARMSAAQKLRHAKANGSIGEAPTVAAEWHA